MDLMKKTLLLLFLLSMVFPALSQSDTTSKKKHGKGRNMDIEFAIGYSFALDNYATCSKVATTKSGYAANGWLAQLTFDWLGKKDVGLAFQYTYQRNPLQDTANNVNPYNTDTSYRLGPGAWSNHYFMAGPAYHHFFKKISVDFKLLLGVLLASSSNFSVVDPTTGQTTKNTGTGFAYQFSAGVGYKVSSHFAFKIQASYLGSHPSLTKQFHYTNKIEKTDPDGNIYYVDEFKTSETTIKKVVSTVNVCLGVIYKF
jgi:opacity protein-like surface antigen